MAERESLLPDVPPSKRKGWRYGVCFGMGGCAWAQFNEESWTYQHFENEDKAREFADSAPNPGEDSDV